MTGPARTDVPDETEAPALRVLLRLARRLPAAPVAGSCVFGALRHLLGVAIIGYAVWAVLTSAPVGTALPVVIVASVLRALARYAEQYLGHRVAFAALARLRLDYYRSLVPQSPAVVAGQRSGDQLERATRDIDRIETFFAHTISPLVSAVVVLLGTTAAVAVLGSGRAALMTAGLLAAQLLLVPVIGARALTAAAATQARLRARVSSRLADAVAARDDIVLAGAVERVVGTVKDTDARSSHEERAAGRRLGARKGMSRAVLLLGVLLAGGWPEPFGLDTGTGLLVAALFLAAHLPLAAVEGSLTALTGALAAARRYLERCDAPPAVPPGRGTATLPPGPLPVSFEDVRFGYDPGADVLGGLSFTVPAGARLGITGGTGSGKSTIAALLVRTWDPREGAVRLGGVDLREVPAEAVRHRAVLVEQSPHMFALSLADNAGLGSDADEEEVSAVLRELGLGELVERGLGTRIGGQRQPVSGGQAQRIGIARALLKRPDLLILDESTSQLDAATQQQVMDVIERRLPDTTIVHILHRTELLERCSHRLAL